MIYHNTPARPGLAAIAAVLALTSTPALAQMIVTDPLGAQAPPAADPPAPMPAPSAPDQAAEAQPVQAEPAVSPKLPDLPVAEARAPKQAASAPTPKPAAVPPAARRWPVTPAVSTVPPSASDAPDMAAQDDLLEPLPVAAPATPAVDAAEAAGSQDGMWLPLAGGLLLASGGAALAIRRRRKSRPVVQARPSDTAPRMAPPPVAARTGTAQQQPVGGTIGDMARLEALVAQPPSPENPFKTRKLRLRRAHHLLRTGQAPAVRPTAPVASVATARSATDRWSEMRVAGQSPVQLSWRPVRG